MEKFEKSKIALPIALASSPGAFAVLLGSGVSVSAGIPSGQEIAKELIRRIALVYEQKEVDDPFKWFKETQDHDPTYSELLDFLTSSQTERCTLLGEFFEPTAKDIENGKKVPTEAHKAIAELVHLGIVKVIITTNFDQLMEKALRDIGINPVIIYNEDSAQGALPIVHNSCTIIKVNGDYKDTRFKNTLEELSSYPEPISQLLTRILEDYGLIICGWSGESDKALLSAIEKRKARRFSVYWAIRDERRETEDLINRAGANKVVIDGADQFFRELLDNIALLRTKEKRTSISETVVSQVKLYLSEEKYKINLIELVREQTELLYNKINSYSYTVPGSLSIDEYRKKINDYESDTKELASILSVITSYDNGVYSKCVVDSINRLSQLPDDSGHGALLNLRLYPSMLLSYTVGISALASENYTTLTAVLKDTNVKDYRGTKPLVLRNNGWQVFSDGFEKIDARCKDRYTPVSDYLLTVMKSQLVGLIPDAERIRDLFDIYEYIQSLTYIYVGYFPIENQERVNPPIGRFSWKYFDSHRYRSDNLIDSFVSKGLSQGNDWGIIKKGLFGGNIYNFKKCRESLMLTLGGLRFLSGMVYYAK